MVQDLLIKLGWSGFSLVFLIAGLYTMKRGREERAQSERFINTKTNEISDLQPGTVEIKGSAHLAADATAIESPIRKNEALATHVEIEQWESSGQGGHWETIHEAQQTVPLTVDDGTGTVRVEFPSYGELNVEANRTEVGSGDEPPEEIKQYLQREDAVDEATRHEAGPISIGERRRYSEGMIEPGEDVYVLGNARKAHAASGEQEYVIDMPAETGDFVLSDKTEEDLVREGKRAGLVSLAFGGLLTVLGITFVIYPWIAM